jgi:hypothetical protein
LIDSGGGNSAWAKSGPGIMFGIGGFFGFIAFIFGMQVGSGLNVLVKVGSEVQGKPTPEQLNKIQAARKKLAVASPVGSIAIIIALACMSVARYWF